MKAAGSAALVLPAVDTTHSAHATPLSASRAHRFPKEFCWGVATSAYQIEGAANEDGKGRSIWDIYTHTPGKIADGSNGDVANDHYHRYKEDVRLIKDMGAKAYRFSIAWSRIFPDGEGTPNAKGLDFYKRLVDELLKAGIEPFATLYHWDLPQALQDKYAGWQSRETAQRFAEYAGYIGAQLSDRVRHFFTINEFYSFVDLGHRGVESDLDGKRIELAPGLRLEPAQLNQVRHHAVLGHGLAVQALRAGAKAGTKCGPADNIGVAVPAIETPEHIQAAQRATREINASYLTAILEGGYPDAYLANAGKDAPKFSDEDMKAIGEPVDFIGLNVYRPAFYTLASDEAPGYRSMPMNPSHPRMHASWLVFGPECLYWAPKFAHSLWKPKAIYITENGCATADKFAGDGHIYDTDRIMFLRHYLTQLQRASAEDAPVKGYFLWSMMDNFEWSEGFGNRFGAIYVDFRTQRRTSKLSAQFFRETVRRNAVL